MSRTDICYEICRLENQTVAPNLTGFQGIKCCVQYLASHSHKPIFILLIITMAQILSDLHEVGIKFNTTQLRIVYSAINMRIML